MNNEVSILDLNKNESNKLIGRLEDLKKKENEPARQEGSIVTLKGREIDLAKLKIGFTLNNQQLEALDKIANFLIQKNTPAFTFSGYAGTGKTSIVKILLKWIDTYFGWDYDFEITAPTNRAKYIIESLSNRGSKTLHSLFGLRPDLELEKLDQKDLKFTNQGGAVLPRNLLIIDEGSLINDTLFKLIIDKCATKGTLILFIGDKAQLQPVKQNHISRIFDIPGAELTQVERQKDGNPLGAILFDIRNNISGTPLSFLNFDEDLLNSKGEGIQFCATSSSFLDKAVEGLRNVSLYGDYLHSRVLAYENARVALYNNIIRGELGFTEEYNKGELVMAYANVGGNPRTGEIGLINSCDYIIENDPKRGTKLIGNTSAEGYYVDLVSTDGLHLIKQFILARDLDPGILEDIAIEMEDLRLFAINARERKEKMIRWNEYYEFKKSFLTTSPLMLDGRIVATKSIDYGYSITCHKSQGGTFKEVFVDYRNFLTCRDKEVKNQLLYVGLSRCMNKATMFI